MTETEIVELLQVIWAEASDGKLEEWAGNTPSLQPAKVQPARRATVYAEVRRALRAVMDEKTYLHAFDDVDFSVTLYEFARALTDDVAELNAEIAKIDPSGILLPARIKSILDTGGGVPAFAALEADLRIHGPRPYSNFQRELRDLLPRVLAGCPSDMQERALDLVLSGQLAEHALVTLAESSSTTVRLRVAFNYQVLGIPSTEDGPLLFARTLKEVADHAFRAAGLVPSWGVNLRIPSEAHEFLRGLEAFVEMGEQGLPRHIV
jgi:hypothetical protein